MSAQHKHWWTEFREWRQSRRQPTPQLTTPWQRVPNACPKHPKTSMRQVFAQDGKPIWKCPDCDTGAMRPVSPLRLGSRSRADAQATQYTILARPVVTVQPVQLPAPKPEPRHYTHEELVEMIRTQKPSPEEVARHIQRADEDRMPGWGTPDWINSVQNIASFAEWQEPNRAEMFADVRQPSQPLDDDNNTPTALHERTVRNRKFNEAITGLLGKDEIA